MEHAGTARTRTGVIWAAGVLVLVLAAAGPAEAHLDPPGPPKIRVEVILDSVTLTGSQDDGIDGNTELLLTASFSAGDHGSGVSTAETDDLNSDDFLVWGIGDRIYDHLECSPATPVAIDLKLVELDSLGILAALSLIGKAIDEMLGLPLTEIPIIGESIGPVAGLGALLGLIEWLNEEDQLGQKNVVLTGAGLTTVELSGSHGGASVEVRQRINERGDGGCKPPPTPKMAKVRLDAGPGFGPLRRALRASAKISPEPGNPAGPTPAEVVDIQSTFARVAIGIAEIGAGNLVDAAAPFDGAADAVAAFEEAQAAASVGDADRALKEFHRAYRHAVRAIKRGRLAPPEMLAPRLALAPDFLAAQPSPDVAIPVRALGLPAGVSVTQVQVLGLPPGTLSQVQQTGPREVVVHLDTRSTVPGSHPVQIVVDAGPFLLQRAVLLVANPG